MKNKSYTVGDKEWLHLKIKMPKTFQLIIDTSFKEENYEKLQEIKEQLEKQWKRE